MLSFRHPAFTDDDAERWINRAFRQDYEANSSSMYRMAETAVRGYEHLATMSNRDACLEARLAQCRDKARSWSLILPAVARNAVNLLEKDRADSLYERAGRSSAAACGSVPQVSQPSPWRRRGSYESVSSVTVCNPRLS